MCIRDRYMAYESAKKDALTQLSEPVPLVIRNAPTRLMKELDYGKGYQLSLIHIFLYGGQGCG